jgi:hypothetical protein
MSGEITISFVNFICKKGTSSSRQQNVLDFFEILTKTPGERSQARSKGFNDDQLESKLQEHPQCQTYAP